jgi:hypothetical protein
MDYDYDEIKNRLLDGNTLNRILIDMGYESPTNEERRAIKDEIRARSEQYSFLVLHPHSTVLMCYEQMVEQRGEEAADIMFIDVIKKHKKKQAKKNK